MMTLAAGGLQWPAPVGGGRGEGIEEERQHRICSDRNFVPGFRNQIDRRGTPDPRNGTETENGKRRRSEYSFGPKADPNIRSVNPIS